MRFEPASKVHGSYRPPPDKSISHRAAIVAAMSGGHTKIADYLRSADTTSTLRAVMQLGAGVEEESAGRHGSNLVVQGVGLRGAHGSEEAIHVGNAGTLLRLLPGWLAGQGSGEWTLDGDESIRRRPVDRIADPLRLMGARVDCRDGRLPPLRVEGGELRGIRYEPSVASAQVKSCVLLAGVLAEGQTTVVEPAPTRDHTERMLRAAGATVHVSRDEGVSLAITVDPPDWLDLPKVEVPGDISSAAFLLAAAAILPGSTLVIEGVCTNPTRTGLLRIMERMGASIDVVDERREGAEPVADLVVHQAPLAGTIVSPEEVPLAIDELPLVALLGAFAEGGTEVRGADELRHKESDRIATVVDGLRGLGAEIEATSDGLVVQGTGGLRGGTLHAAGDHRLAMLGAIAGVASRDGVEVDGFEVTEVSYPRFGEDLALVIA
jgi:3-phosphoshikimate 1-carboxyvinyltransferase